MILLDTSVLSRVFRRRSPGPEEHRLQQVVADLLTSDTPIAIPGIVLQEILSGIRLERQFRELRDRLFHGFTIVLPTVQDHVEAARLKNRCLARGYQVSGTDCLIAALALAGPFPLFALDGHFEQLAQEAKGLRIYDGER